MYFALQILFLSHFCQLTSILWFSIVKKIWWKSSPYVAPYKLRRMICMVKIFDISPTACITMRNRLLLFYSVKKLFWGFSKPTFVLRMISHFPCKSCMDGHGCALSSMVGNPGHIFFLNVKHCYRIWFRLWFMFTFTVLTIQLISTDPFSIEKKRRSNKNYLKLFKFLNHGCEQN